MMSKRATVGSASLTSATVVVRCGDLLGTELASGELVLLDVDQGTYFGVAGVARLVWDALATPVTVTSLVEDVQAAFPEVDAAKCERDVHAFVSDLLANGLARIVASDSTG